MQNSNSISYGDEEVLWDGSPSQWVNAGTFLWWSLVLLCLIFFRMEWHVNIIPSGVLNLILGKTTIDMSMLDTIVTNFWFCAVVIVLVRMIYAYLIVKCEHTVITKNKIKESKGITSVFRKDLYCELSDVNDFKSPPAGLMGLIGLSTLVLETQDNDQRIITIRGIRNREELENKIRPIWRKLKIDRKGYF